MKNIMMYSTDWCGDCVRSEALLKSLNVSFDVVNVDKDDVANSCKPTNIKGFLIFNKLSQLELIF